jgi:gas vesicle protein
MNNDHHNSHFSDGFLLGVVVGAAAVFLLGTKSGKNILKVFSEQGIDGIKDLIEEYNLSATEEEFEEESPEVIEDLKKKGNETKNHIEEKVKMAEAEASSVEDEVREVAPKKRFFKRIRR